MIVGDRASVEREWDGDDQAFSALFDAWHGPITGYLQRLTGDREVANDLAPERCSVPSARNARRNVSWADEPHFRAWLYRIATNHAHSWR